MNTKKNSGSTPARSGKSNQGWLFEQLVETWLTNPHKPGLTININIKQTGSGNALNVLASRSMCKTSIKTDISSNAKTRELELERENVQLREELANLRQLLNSSN